MDRIKNKKTIGGIALASILVAGMFTFMPQNASADLTALDKIGTIITIITNIQNILLDPDFGLEEIKREIRNIEDSVVTPATCDPILGTVGYNVVFGTSGADTFDDGEGTAGNDLVILGAGDDTLTFTEGGDDIICGGPDNDTITLTSDGDNIIDGEDGNDTMTVVGTGDNTLIGRDGNDTMTGGDGNDTMTGGPGNDTMTGGPGNDTMTGGTGDDTITGSAGTDFADGGPTTNDTCDAETEVNCEI